MITKYDQRHCKLNHKPEYYQSMTIPTGLTCQARKYNEIRLDVSILNSGTKSKLISIFCMDVVYAILVLIMYNMYYSLEEIYSSYF